MKSQIANLLSKYISIEKKQIENLIEIPPSQEMGDFAFPCFALAKEFKKNPLEIAKEISQKIKTKEFEIKSSGPYINFFLNRRKFALGLIEKIKKEKKNFGKNNLGKGKIITIDMSSPNIAKPIGIGHLRSTIIGNSISEIAKFNGYKTIKINYLGDWGTQFGKLIVGYKRWGKEKELKKNPIKHMLELYVKANAEEYEQEARDWFKKLEEKNLEAIKIWKMFKEFSLKEFDEIYKTLGINFDVISGESFYNNKMENTIKELENKKLLEKNQGALIVDLKKYNLGACLIKKSDGATLYATRDITAAIDRYKKYKFDKMIYEVGQEQKLHFQQFFKVLDLMGYNFAKNCIHVYHGLYLDSDGKKFATRKGKTVFMKEILDETIESAKKGILQRDKNLNKKEIDKRARKIAIAAIFYGDLKNNKVNDIVFNIDKFLDFEGDTGPYLLYSYARASSILRKSKPNKNSKIKINSLEEKEIELIKKISEFPEIVLNAYKNLNPSVIANYSYQLAQIFSEFYHTCPVIGDEKENFRLELVKSFRQVLKNSLGLLGIETMEEM